MLARLLAVVALFGWALAEAQECPRFAYRLAESTTNPPQATSFLLEITPVATPPSYILGTFHSADPAVLSTWGKAGLLLAILPVERFISERDLKDQSGLGAQQLAAGESLPALLEDQPGLYPHIVELLTHYGLPSADAGRFKPWFVAALLNQATALPRRPGEQVLDEYLLDVAVELGLQTQHLETFTSIARYYEDNFALPAQIQLLWEAVCNQEILARLVDEQTAAYTRNDVAEFYRLGERYEGGDKALSERVIEVFLARRNADFWRKLEPEIQGGRVFIAVGGLHVFGAGGLLEHLRAATPAVAVRALDPAALDVSLSSDDVPVPRDWVEKWLRAEGLGSSDTAPARIDRASLGMLRQRLCPERPCAVEATYRTEDHTILIADEIYARLLASAVVPRFALENGTLRKSAERGGGGEYAYEESLLVRELARHALYQTAPAHAAKPDDPCLKSTILHWAALAQQVYLATRNSPRSAHPFALDTRCPALFGKAEQD